MDNPFVQWGPPAGSPEGSLFIMPDPVGTMTVEVVDGLVKLTITTQPSDGRDGAWHSISWPAKDARMYARQIRRAARRAR